MIASSRRSTAGFAGFPGNVPAVVSESGEVSLTIPAKPGYLVLARLTLSAVCRLTPLEPAEVADLKLAVTEAASDFVEAGGEEDTVAFDFRLDRERLAIELSGPAGRIPAEDQELSRAIIEATVDQADFSDGRTLLAKRLEA